MLNQFKEDLIKDDEITLYQNYILGHKVWLFDEKLKKPIGYYDDVKKFFARSLHLQMNNIAIVGSSKLGFSLNPKNLFREFQETSDIDLIVVDSTLFRQSWDAFLLDSKNRHIASYERLTSGIFQRYVTIKNPNIHVPFFKDWTVKMDTCKRDLQIKHGIYNDLNYRIYDSWESVQSYHTYGITKIKKHLERSKNE